MLMLTEVFGRRLAMELSPTTALVELVISDSWSVVVLVEVMALPDDWHREWVSRTLGKSSLWLTTLAGLLPLACS